MGHCFSLAVITGGNEDSMQGEKLESVVEKVVEIFKNQ